MAEDESERSPFTRPAFLIAAVLVILIVVVGIVVVVVNLNRHDPSPSANPSHTASAAPTTEPSDVASVCGLSGTVLTGNLSTAPDATWKYDGTTAYPTSSEYGPAKTTADGVRYCFQHSPQGALFASANGLVAASAADAQQAWLSYFLANGPHKQSILDSLRSGSSSTSGTRLNVAGFRLLSYDGSTATVDIAVQGSTAQGSITGSFVYDLVWQAGDWRLSADVAEPFSFAVIPDLAGYIQWRS